MIPVYNKTIGTSISKFKSDIDKIILDGHTNLVALKGNTKRKFNASEVKYLNNLIKNYRKIVLASPSQLKTLSNKFPLPNATNKKRKEKFKNDILKAMGYANARSKFYPKYFQDIGIKSCIYCNAQLAVSVESEISSKTKRRIKIKAKFQVDHYFPKAKYPCFSISFFNLYPVCASCNNSKSEKRIDFNLYSSSTSLLKSPFSFELDYASVIDYILSRNPQDITIKFDYPKPRKGFQDFSKTFDIQGVYDTQKDLAEELILKAEVYTQSYKQSLMKMFPDVFTKTNITNRLIIGNYPEHHEIHKRPMSKFTQDIARQLGLL